MDDFVTIFEVSPRDGLQNEARMIGARDKIRLVDLLTDCGFTKIEVTSFVSAKWVPQMADGAEVMAGINRKDETRYAALVPNMRGFDAAAAAQADEIAVFAAASEAFSEANINCSIEESFARFDPIIEAANEAIIPVRGYISCVTDCPYSGPVDPAEVAQIAARMIEMGCYEVSLGDTIGAGTPESVARMLEAVLAEVSPERLAGHFHDTNGRAVENIQVSLGAGLRVFDAAAGGLGGCPYAPGAAGNVATETVVEMLHAQGYRTGLNEKKLAQAADFAKGLRA